MPTPELTPARKLELYYWMRLTRTFDDAMLAHWKQGRGMGGTFSQRGHEAISVGAACALQPEDLIAPMHRDLGAYLVRGLSPRRIFGNLLGRAGGVSAGRDANLHGMGDLDHNIIGFISHLTHSLGAAVGVAMAFAYRNEPRVAMTFVGDGSASLGLFHESMNLAASLPSPTIFVCEQNLFSSHLHISLRQPSSRIARYAEAHCIPHGTVDGNDLGAVLRASEEAVAHARTSRRPYFLEFVTYRWRGHVGHREDIDVGVRRKDDLHLWKRRDPIRRCADALTAAGKLSASELDLMTAEVRAQVQSAWEFALSSAYPSDSALMSRVYAGGGAE